MKIKKLKFIIFLLVLLSAPVIVTTFRVIKSQVVNVYADDEEEDEEDDDEGEGSSKTTSTTETVTEVVPAQTKTEVVYKPVLDPSFTIDTDSDGLMDALDPHPTVSEKLYFTDTDGDSVSDALDAYPGEDDLDYFDDSDSNNDGILDSYE
jgi:hypothetical protein